MDIKKASKAVAGVCATLTVALLARMGFILNPEATDAVNLLTDLLVTSAIGWLVVYLAPKNKGA